MRIQVQRAGGFAGLTRRAEVDTSARRDADEWQALAEQAVATGCDTPLSGVPDGFHYQITVDDRTVHCADPHLSEAQRALISRVLKEGA